MNPLSKNLGSAPGTHTANGHYQPVNCSTFSVVQALQKDVD